MAGEASFDRGAAAALWGLTDALDADDALAALRDAGLLEEGADGRCAQHPLLSCARALLDAAGETAAAQERHFAHYQQAYGGIEALELSERRSAVQTDAPNIRAAIQWALALDNSVEQAVELLMAFDGGYLQFEKSLQVRVLCCKPPMPLPSASTICAGRPTRLGRWGT